MFKITVLFPIVVPGGKYCWHDPSQSLCEHFNNEYGPECDLKLGELKYTKEGFVCKCENCLNLQQM